MNKLRIFISSVQSEFAKERQMLYDFILTDALLGKFFEPFIFEKLPATDIDITSAYLKELKQSNIYLGIFGKNYGFENTEGISPTEIEFQTAGSWHKTRLIFISHHNSIERHPKQLRLIEKAEGVVVRKLFNNPVDLKTSVYASLIRYLEEKEIIRSGPFDATICKEATMEDIDNERIEMFVKAAQSKRGFPFSHDTPVEKILTHLNLINAGRLSNAAVLLFGKLPQHFFIASEIRCVMFYGNEVEKPFPVYQVYKGNVFQLVDQAVDFILSRINLFVGDRKQSVDVPVRYEIPRAAISEAIVNAIAHRDYTSNGSVQIMLFRNRLEVWNPGQLPIHLSIDNLKRPHGSYPTNPLLAEPLYLAGYIERLGTGIPDMINQCIKAGLAEPEFFQEDSFKVILWRKSEKTEQPTEQPTEQVNRLILIMEDIPFSLNELMGKLELKHRPTFMYNYLKPALENKWIEMTNPETPNNPNQRYRLTKQGILLKAGLKK